nr:MAG TPA: hypothetical protein [Siphoviridae sp. ctqtA1]
MIIYRVSSLGNVNFDFLKKRKNQRKEGSKRSILYILIIYN